VTPADKPGAPLAVFDVPKKFEGGGPWLVTKGGYIGYWTVDRVYADPCGAAGSTRVGPAVEDLATALVAQKLTTTTKPIPVSIDGHDGLYLELTAPADIDYDDCSRVGGLPLWDTHVAGLRGVSEPAVDRYWILNVFGQRVVLLTSVRPGADKETVEQLSSMVATTTFLEAD
jgi:hypothetical protein